MRFRRCVWLVFFLFALAACGDGRCEPGGPPRELAIVLRLPRQSLQVKVEVCAAHVCDAVVAGSGGSVRLPHSGGSVSLTDRESDPFVSVTLPGGPAADGGVQPGATFDVVIRAWPTEDFLKGAHGDVPDYSRNCFHWAVAF